MVREDQKINVPEEVLRLHQEAVVVDAHHDIPLDIWRRRIRGEKRVLASVWEPELRQGGVNVQGFPVFSDSQYTEMALRVVLKQIEALYADTDEDPGDLRWVRTYEEIEAAVADNKVAGIMALEGCEGLGYDIEIISLLYRLGVRMISLTWNRRNAFADGVAERGTKGGLTTLGLQALREMNRLGVIVDVSHISETGFWDVLNHAGQPVIASHTNCRVLCDHPRNFTDEQIKALAKTGGVMGLVLFPGFVDLERPTLARAVNHIIHVGELAGIEHVGLGSDLTDEFLRNDLSALPRAESLMSGNTQFSIKGCGRICELPNLTGEMLRRGLSEEEIKAVLGGNFLRIFRDILSE